MDGNRPPATAAEAADAGDEKQTLTSLARFRLPLGGQEIELQQLDYVHGGMPLLRLRIREGKRFTIFDIDPVSAGQWGEVLCRWAAANAADSAAGR
jgi:hypothetical protein